MVDADREAKVAKEDRVTYRDRNGYLFVARCDKCYDSPAEVYHNGFAVCCDCRKQISKVEDNTLRSISDAEVSSWFNKEDK